MGEIVLVEGFDDWLLVEDTVHGWAGTYALAAGRVEGLAIRVSNTSITRTIPASDRYSATFYWTGSAWTTAQSILGFREGGTTHISLVNNVDGTLSVHRGTTSIATSGSLGLYEGGGAHVEMDVTVHDSAGVYEVRVNGVPVIGPTTGVDTQNGGVGVINTLALNAGNSSANLWDDLIVTKDGGFHGDCRVVTDVADASGTSSDMTVVGIPAYKAIGAFIGSAADVSPSWPTHAKDDIGLLIVETCGGQPALLTTPNGFVAVANSPQATGTTTNGTQLSVYWCRATSSSMSDPYFSDGGDHIFAGIITFKNCIKSGDPIDLTVGGVKASASTAFSATGLTTSEDNELVVVIGTDDDDSANGNFPDIANANLTNSYKRLDGGSTSGNGGGIVVFAGTKATAGATGNTTATMPVSSTNAFLTLAFKPMTSHYEVINDEYHDDDESYLLATASGQRDTFEFPALGVSGTVRAVAIGHYARKDDAGDRLITTSIRRSSTNYDNVVPQTLDTSYLAQQQIYELDPSTGLPWEVADIEAGEFGVQQAN